MTVSASPIYVELAWTGAETTFAPGIAAQDVAHIGLSFRAASGAIVTLANGVNLLLSKSGLAGATGVISATPVAMPPAPGTVIFQRSTPAIQATPFVDLAKFSASTHEKLHDAAALRDAELAAGKTAAVRAPSTETINELPPAATRAGGVILFDATGQPIVEKINGTGTVIVSGVARFATRAAVGLATIDAGITSIETDGYMAAGDGGGARYYRVNAMPAHQGRVQSHDGAWFEIDRRRLWPEQFGQIGVSAINDTAAFNAMFGAGQNGSKFYVKQGATYQIVGSPGGDAYANVGATCDGLDSPEFNFGGATFQTNSAATRAFRIRNCTGDVRWRRGTFKSYSDYQISVGSSPADWQPIAGGGGTYVGASYLHFQNCARVTVDGVRGTRGCGIDIFINQCPIAKVKNCDLPGIGSAYIHPIDNGSDFGIAVFQASATPTGPDVEVVLENNRCYDHAHGAQVVGAANLLVLGGKYRGIGQHGIYAIEADVWKLVGVSFDGCYQFAFKNQLENYAATVWYTTPWDVAHTYLVGDRRVNSRTLYICAVSHTSGADFATDLAAGKWKIDPLMRRQSGSVASCSAIGCGWGVAVMKGGVLVDGVDAYQEVLNIANFTFKDGIADGTGNGAGIRAERVKQVNINGATIVRPGQNGFYGVDFGGNISNFTVVGSPTSAIYAQPAWNVQFRNITLENCGQAVAASPVIYVLNIDPATTVPSKQSVIFAKLADAELNYFNGDTPGGDPTNTSLAYFDSSIRVRLFNVNTNSTKPFRILGTLLKKWGNDPAHTEGINQSVYTIVNSTSHALTTATATTTQTGDVLGTLIGELASYGGLH